MINTVEPPPKIPRFSIRLGTHNSTIRCATTVTPQCGRGINGESREVTREPTSSQGRFSLALEVGQGLRIGDIVSKGCNTISTLQHYVALKIVVTNRPV